MPDYPSQGPVTLKANLGDYPAYKSLKDGTIASDLIRFDFPAFKTPVDGFKPIVRERCARLRRTGHRHVPAGEGLQQAGGVAAGNSRWPLPAELRLLQC